MLYLKKYWFTMVLLCVSVIIYFFGSNTFLVETYYSTGIYPIIGNCLRLLTQHFPFSIGDFFYLFLGIYLLYNCVSFIHKKKWKQFNNLSFISTILIKAFSKLLFCYVFFKLIWGLNYNRLGIEYQMNLPKTTYCKEQVNEFIDELIVGLNETRGQIKDTSLPYLSLDSIYIVTSNSYKQLSVKFPYLKYSNTSIKSSIYSQVGRYFNFSGYYNPFIGEAQVRYDIPRINVPFIACHEVAHQLGYASESEANFVGFIATQASRNKYFKYSAYLDLLTYMQNELAYKYFEDFEIIELFNRYEQIKDCLSPQVLKDRKAIKNFYYKEITFVDKTTNFIYDRYLKINSQPDGVESYDKVIGLIMALKYCKQ